MRRRKITEYLDLSSEADSNLQLIASLLSKMGLDDVLESKDAHQVAIEIEGYLVKKRIRERALLNKND